VVTDIEFELVCSYRDQQRYEASFKKTAVEPAINDKNWYHTLDNIKKYVASQYGGTGDSLNCVIRAETTVESEAEDPVGGYDTVGQGMTARALHSGRAFVNDRHNVWDIMSNICGRHSCFVYINTILQANNGRNAFILLFDHFIGPNNGDNMASAAETNLTGTVYNGEKKIFTWEMYVRIHRKHHHVLNGLKDYGYAGIDESSKVRHLLKCIKTNELDVCKMQVMVSPNLCDDFTATVQLYANFIKQMQAEKSQLNVSEVSFARGKKEGQ
jgi:hypothetical protein